MKNLILVYLMLNPLQFPYCPSCPVKYRGLKFFSVSKNGGWIYFFLLEFVSTLQTIFARSKACIHGRNVPFHFYPTTNSRPMQNGIGSGCQTFSRNCSKYVSPSKTSFYFDTHKMVTDFNNCDFSLQQSEMITSAIADVVHSTVGNLKGKSVSRVEQEQQEVRLKSLIEKVRNDMTILEKTEFVRMKDECGKLKSEVASLKYLLQEEVVKLKSNQALDTSLERSRVKEEFQFRDQKIKDNNNRIDTEVARVETKIEAQKLDLLKYLVGSVLSLCTIILAFWRFFKM